MKSIATAILGAVLCTGCAPLPVTIVSLMADGVSYATTEKSLTDHGISALSNRDCAVHRILTDGVMCHDFESETVVTAMRPVERHALDPVPRAVATDSGNIAVSHLGNTGEPIPGVYMVVATSRDLKTARTYGIWNADIAPQVFAMPAGGRRVMYHVIVGPMTEQGYYAARKSAASYGYKNTWALKIEESDWRRAKEIERREQLRQAAEQASVPRR